MLLFYNIVYFAILGIGFITSILTCFYKEIAAWIKLFAPFLLVTIIISIIGEMKSFKGESNQTLYSFFNIVEYDFFFFVLLRVIKNKHLKRIILFTIGLYPAIALTDIFLIQGINVYNTFSYYLGAILIIAFGGYHFYELFKAPKSKLSRQPAFWISIGLLIYYSTTIPLYMIVNIVSELSGANFIIWAMLSFVTNYFLYGFCSIGLFCAIKFRKQA